MLRRKEGFWNEWVKEFGVFLVVLVGYWRRKLSLYFEWFEVVKGVVVGQMYRQRGRYAGIFIHLGMVVLVFLGLTVGPSVLAGSNEQQRQWVRQTFGDRTAAVELTFGVGSLAAEASIGGGQVLGTNVEVSTTTQESDKPRAGVVEYTVQSGDTLGSVAGKFGVSMDTIRWLNEEVKSVNSIKPGQVLKIPPVTGVVHTVRSGETIYSVAKKYEADAQSIVDFPFNTFTNDETFALAVGQTVYVPDGTKPAEVPWSPSSSLARTLTPNAGVVSATGVWIWPAQGNITQGWRPWHKGIDVANRSGGQILAADAGRIVVAGWPDNFGYGNRVVIEHGNGYQTLYAHLSKISVVSGQTVKRGDVLGAMGSTGRSTGTHLHFEVRQSSRGLNPLDFLK